MSAPAAAELDFLDVEALAAENSLALMSRLFPPPAGKRRGAEYLFLNPLRDDRGIGSCKVNLLSGAFCDFARPDTLRGSGFLSLVEQVCRADRTSAMPITASKLDHIPSFLLLIGLSFLRV